MVRPPRGDVRREGSLGRSDSLMVRPRGDVRRGVALTIGQSDGQTKVPARRASAVDRSRETTESHPGRSGFPVPISYAENEREATEWTLTAGHTSSSWEQA